MIRKQDVFKVLVCCVMLFVMWASNYNVFSWNAVPGIVPGNQYSENLYKTAKRNVTLRSNETQNVRSSGYQTFTSFRRHVQSDQTTSKEPTTSMSQLAGSIPGQQTSFRVTCHNPSMMNFSNAITEPFVELPETFYLEQTRNCSAFRHSRGYSHETGTQEEKDFPLAYSIIMYKDVDRVERLLRAIYQPQNFYCIHVDAEADRLIHDAMSAIVSCFPNVFTIDQPIKVSWGKFSVLEVELICMKALWKYQWKYFINLTGQEFPLKTNWELVKIFKTYNGANDVDGTNKTYGRGLRLERFNKQSAPLPMNVTLSKGSVHVAVQRGFVDFVLHKAQPFVEWLKKTRVPDETFFNTLNNSPQLGVPGAFTGEPVRHKNKPHIVRYKLWEYYSFKKPYYDWYPDWGFIRCHGQYQRHICIFSLPDLPHLTASEKMFANKFSKTYEPLAYDCLEAWHLNKLHMERQGYREFNTSYYETLDFVKQHV